MTTEYEYAKGKNKSFVGDYVYGDQCLWNDFPRQKVFLVYLGIRPAIKSGLRCIFETNDYSQNYIKGIHKNKSDLDDLDVIYRIIDQLFDRIERMAE